MSCNTNKKTFFCDLGFHEFVMLKPTLNKLTILDSILTLELIINYCMFQSTTLSLKGSFSRRNRYGEKINSQTELKNKHTDFHNLHILKHHKLFIVIIKFYKVIPTEADKNETL